MFSVELEHCSTEDVYTNTAWQKYNIAIEFLKLIRKNIFTNIRAEYCIKTTLLVKTQP